MKIDLSLLGLLAATIAVAFLGVYAGQGQAQETPPGRFAVAAGVNFGLVVDQSRGTVWRCDAVDIKCDKLRLEE